MDCLIVERREAASSLRQGCHLYPKMLGYLLFVKSLRKDQRVYRHHGHSAVHREATHGGNHSTTNVPSDYIRTSNAALRPRPYRKTAKSLSNKMTREMPSRYTSAKDVRLRREKSWSGTCSPIAHAASRSALVVCSIVATPLRNSSQKVSAASESYTMNQLKFLVDATYKDRRHCEYDLSLLMKRTNS